MSLLKIQLDDIIINDIGVCHQSIKEQLKRIGGALIKVEELANTLQVCLDSGAKKVLLPLSFVADLASVPPELVGAFNLIFYKSPEDAVFKALGVE